MWVYQHTESQLWTVGYYDPQDKWITEGDYDSQRDAAERVAWLNGETTYRSAVAHDFAIKTNARIAELEAQLERARQSLEYRTNLLLTSMDKSSARIAELEAQLAAALATIERAL
jgi:multidrug resistance efflux pump